MQFCATIMSRAEQSRAEQSFCNAQSRVFVMRRAA